ncbi:oligosaccharide flippase family protein [Vibrio alginolyticus]|uniref:oligosaccharide flippase family protein n=1 Tax=Vibrio alginolyticus TaxID=663 RepID=UPI001BD2D24B|nr:oligosaccharide flippase family protein [Vibrio alginolyticus]EME9802038.1 oligosaccharide flippase family protein [Vibrio alginolyticus]MBS9837485.1 oligosaccharide flippase family protein [Vibrio alginolyticus]
MNNFKIYFLSNLVSAAVPFLLLPILTRYLTTVEYGQIAIYQILFTFFSSVIGLSTHASVYRESFDMEAMERSEYIGSCVQITMITSLIIVCIISFFGQLLSVKLNIPLNLIYLAVGASTLNYFLLITLGQLQIIGKARKFACLQVFLSVTNVVISVHLVTQLSLGAEGRAFGHGLSIFFGSFISLVFLLITNNLNVCQINFENYRKALDFGLPLVPHAVFSFLLLNIDRVIINERMGVDSVGLYLSAVQVSMGISILYDAALKAFSPWLNRKLNSENIEDKYVVRVQYRYMVSASIIVILISLLIIPTFTRVILGASYSQASEFVAFLCIAQVFRGLYQLFSCILQFYKKTIYIMYCSVSCGVINMLLIFLLIEQYGLVGVSLAFMLSAFLLLTSVILLSCKNTDYSV